MLSKILVPLDGSALAERALSLGMEIAEGIDAQLVLFRVIPYFTILVADPLLYEEMNRMGEDEAHAYLRHLRSDVVGDIPADIACEVGSAAEAILQYAQANEVGLIVMSSHGRSGLNRWVYGSVAERVLSKAPCPVLITNARQEAWQPEIKKLLVPLDGSALAEEALVPAAEMVQALDAQLHLLRVTPSEHSRFETASMADVFSDIELNEVEEAEAYLEEKAAAFDGVDVHLAATVSDGSVAETIVNYAEAHDIDLIVMSSHGRTGLQKWVYGSVAEKVLRSACCATLIVRNK